MLGRLRTWLIARLWWALVLAFCAGRVSMVLWDGVG